MGTLLEDLVSRDAILAELACIVSDPGGLGEALGSAEKIRSQERLSEDRFPQISKTKMNKAINIGFRLQLQK